MVTQPSGSPPVVGVQHCVRGRVQWCSGYRGDEAAVGDLTDRHLVLRTVFSFDQNHDAWPIQVATATPVTLIEVASEDYEAASADLVAAGFDLATDAPLRLILASGSDATTA